MTAKVIGTLVGAALPTLFTIGYLIGYYRGAKMATELGKKHLDDYAKKTTEEIRKITRNIS